MHISNKYNPYKRSRKKWECWPIRNSKLDGMLAQAYLQYAKYGWQYYLEEIERLENNPPKFETNNFYFGAYQKPNGAWGSSNAANYLKSAKKNSTHVYRRKEKEALKKYLKQYDLEDDIGNIIHGEGYWD